MIQTKMRNMMLMLHIYGVPLFYLFNFFISRIWFWYSISWYQEIKFL